MERILKGQEIALPGGVHFQDTYGFKRQHVRRRWWDPAAVNYRKSALLPQDEAEQLPDIALPVDQVFQVDQSRPTLFGHYCLSDGSPLLYPNFGCVDTCASRGKRLTAYQWDGEQMLALDKFRSVLV